MARWSSFGCSVPSGEVSTRPPLSAEGSCADGGVPDRYTLLLAERSERPDRLDEVGQVGAYAGPAQPECLVVEYDTQPNFDLNGGAVKLNVSLRSNVISAVIAGVIYLIIYLATGGGVAGAIIGAVIVAVIVFLIAFAFSRLIAPRLR
jgi:hypothetical protein